MVMPCIGHYPKNASFTHRLELTPWIEIDSWAMPDVSMLSSTAREYNVMKYFPFVTS